MMSLETIRSMSDEAARRAKRAKKQPWHPETIEDITVDNLRKLPHLGSFTPPKWEDTEDNWFVDSSGFGSEGEPALTINQLVSRLKEHFATHPCAGYAIGDVGQFQLYVHAYEYKGGKC